MESGKTINKGAKLVFHKRTFAVLRIPPATVPLYNGSLSWLHACFWEAAMPPSPKIEPLKATPSPARVLIAEDNPQNLELLEAYLTGTQFEIATATDGEETLQKIHSWKPDLVLLDIMMPKISGFEVCKRLRADPATQDIGVLMVTALDQPSDVERAVEAGTDDFLTKTINKKDLLLRARSILQSRHNKRDLDRALAYIEAVEQGKP